jgi:hypothetical protein
MFGKLIPASRTLSVLALSLFAAGAVGCGGSDDSTAPSGGNSDGSTPPPASSDARVSLRNSAASGSVMFFRSRACGTTLWGSDMLGSSILGAGEEQSWTVTPGCYDFRATPAEQGLNYVYFTNVQIDAGETEQLEITAFPTE